MILAAVLSRNGKMLPALALTTCLVGVLAGDFVVYFLGYFYGEKVLSLPLTRRLLTRRAKLRSRAIFTVTGSRSWCWDGSPSAFARLHTSRRAS